MRKRMAIGLSPQRPTAQAAHQRPPERQRNDRRRIWTLVGLIAAMMVVTMLLVVVRVADAPTSWPDILRSVGRLPGRILNPTEAGVRFPAVLAAGRQTDLDSIWSTRIDFGKADLMIAESARSDAFVIGPDPEEGVYRMRLWPDNVAWVIVGPDCSASHQIETETLLDIATPSGQAMLVGRFHDERNFYLFGVNGKQEFEVIMVKDGLWTADQAPQYDAAINPAGIVNTLALHDDGDTMRFTANGKILFQEQVPDLAIGRMGLAGRAVQAPTQVDVKSLHVSASLCQEISAAR